MKNYKVDIKGYEGIYQISRDGKVFSLKNDLEFKLSIGTTGYYRVNLNNKDRGKTHKVHRLVALHFIPNPNNYKCVNHLDGNKLNNDMSNLEWCSHKRNNNHARELGLNPILRGLDSPLIKSVKRHDTGEIFLSLDSACRACGQYRNRSGLSNHLAGRHPKFDGTTWEFVNEN
jgi:hypothetical protein